MLRALEVLVRRDVEALVAALCLPSIPDDELLADLEVGIMSLT